MDRYKETFATWNKVAELYQEKFMDLDIYKETYDFVCNTLSKKSAKLLDVGCGPGNISKYLLSKRPDFNIVGIDIAPNMVALAEKNVPTAQFSVLDIREISTLNTTFDGIICGFCLPYLSHADSIQFFADCLNLLNEQGLLYLSFMEGDPKESGFKAGSSGDKTYFYYHTLQDVTNQLKQFQFKDVRKFEVSYKKSDDTFEMHTILTASRNSSKI